MMQKNYGITLVALVITIVVLLILVSITIYSITNENGIIEKSKESKELTEISQEKEALETSIIKLLRGKREAIIEDNEEDREKLQNNLEKYTGDKNISVSSAKDVGYIFKVTFEKTKRDYYVNDEGEVTDTIIPKYTVCAYFENIEDSDFSLEKTKVFEISDENSEKVQISTLVSEISILGGTFSHATIDEDTVTEFTEEQGKTVNLYYTRNSYTLTLDKADNIASVFGSGVYKYGQNVEISATLANTNGSNVTFETWESSNSELLPNQKSQNTTIQMPNGDITLTAIASSVENTYTIAFSSNGGTGTMTSMTNVKYTESVTLRANTFTRAGYTFDGWSTSATGGKVYDDKAVVKSLAESGTITLYAVWKSGSINEDFEDTNIDPQLTLSSSNYSVSDGRYVVTSWTGTGTTTASAEITFTAAEDGTLSFDYGEVGKATFNFSYKITLKNVTDGTSTTLKNVGQVVSADHNGSVSTAVTAGKQYTIVLENTSYTIYGLKPYIDNLKVEY